MQVELGRVADVQIGYQVAGKVRPRSDDTHLLVQTVDVSGSGSINWEGLSPFAPDRKIGDRYTLVDGDVLFLAKGPRRVAAVVRRPRPHTLAVSTFFILRVRAEAVILPEYLAWFLNVAAQEQIEAMEHRTTSMAFVPKEALEKLVVDLPPTATQQRIVRLNGTMQHERRLTLELLDHRARLVSAVAKRAMTSEKE